MPARAFADCRSLLQISLPDTLTVISEKAFANCAMLSTICLPRSLGVLSQNAFDGCYRLVTLYTDSYLATTLTGTHPMFANVLQFYITESVGNILPATLPVGYTKATVQDVLLYVKYIKS